jgi:hypothetical protein
VLFAEIPRQLLEASPHLGLLASQIAQFTSVFAGRSKSNPQYPSEDYEAFVLRMIKAKKKLIEKLLSIEQ